MKVGSKGFYVILALAQLARTYRSGRPVQVREIAKRQKIPEEFPGHIMVLLKRADLVRSNRGPGGGYHLANPPETISVAIVLKVLEGPIVDSGVRDQKKYSPGSVVARRLMETCTEAAQASENILREVTLADLCRPEEGKPHVLYLTGDLVAPADF